METQEEIKKYKVSTSNEAPSIFSYMDYRHFLKDYYNYKKKNASSFSLGTFAAKAGIQTRNYLKRVTDGERSLSPNLIPKFCNALSFTPKERAYFESLVHFNQAKDEETKKHYFALLKETASNIPNRAIAILENQYNVFSAWYILPVRELVLLSDFREDPQWIAHKMKNRINKKEALSAIDILIKSGLLIRDTHTKKLNQAEPLIEYSQEVINMAVRGYHRQTLDNTKVAIDEDQFGSWNLRSLNVAIPRSELKNVHQELNKFFEKMNLKLTELGLAKNKQNESETDTVIQLNAQIIEVTKTNEEK